MMKDKTICDHLEMLWKRIPKAPTPATVTHLKNNSQSQMSLNQKAMCLGLLFYRGGLDQELELVEKSDWFCQSKRLYGYYLKDFLPICTLRCLFLMKLF